MKSNIFMSRQHCWGTFKKVIPNLVRTTYACFWNISDDLTYSSRRHRETLYVLALNRGMGFKRSFQKDVA